MTKANANALFTGLKAKPSFARTITIDRGDPEDALLLEARRAVRNAIRSGFKGVKVRSLNLDDRLALFEQRDRQFRDAADILESINVRFLTQGSYAYRTLNRPAQPACQEIDLDDGIYVPMPFIKDRPIFSSDGLFRLIERMLRPLLAQRGWSFKRKSTCIRVCLTGQNAHIDLPLFAVEDAAFRNLSQLYEALHGTSFESTKHNLNDSLNADRSIRLQKRQILLADRNEDWRESDPKAVHDWFEDQVERLGPVLRRVCRYLKAWRDETWETCSLSSLTLMVLSVEVLHSLERQPAADRDDLVLLRIAEQLPSRLRRGSIVWRPGERPLDAKWTAEDRESYESAAAKLFEEIEMALNHTFNRDVVVLRFTRAFGTRFPQAPESVLIAAAAQTAAVLETKAASVPLPLVGTSVSA